MNVRGSSRGGLAYDCARLYFSRSLAPGMAGRVNPWCGYMASSLLLGVLFDLGALCVMPWIFPRERGLLREWRASANRELAAMCAVCCALTVVSVVV